MSATIVNTGLRGNYKAESWTYPMRKYFTAFQFVLAPNTADESALSLTFVVFVKSGRGHDVSLAQRTKYVCRSEAVG